MRPKSETENEATFEQIVYENLKTSGVLNRQKNERLRFEDIDTWSGKRIQYRGVYIDENGNEKKAAIAIGPEYGTVTRSFACCRSERSGGYV